MRCQRIAGTVIFPLGKTQHGFDQDGNIPYRFCRQTAFPIQSAILFDTQQERGKLFRRQARNSDMAEMRKDVPLKQKVIAGARGDFNIGLRQILREKLFYRQAAGTDRLLWQRLYRSDQLLFYNGLSYTKSQGKVSYLPNPYIQDNLAFSFQLEYQAALYYPTLYRGIYLAGLRYNLHLKKRALLLEAGAQTNTVQEVKNAMEPFADILNRVLERV